MTLARAALLTSAAIVASSSLGGCVGGATKRPPARVAAPAAGGRAAGNAAQPVVDPEQQLLDALGVTTLAPERDAASPQRPMVRPIQVRIADLPVAHLAAALAPSLSPPALRGDETPTRDLSVRSDPGFGRAPEAPRRVSVNGFASATLSIGPWAGPAGPTDGGVSVPCGRAAHDYGSIEVARWEGIVAEAGAEVGAHARYAIVDGWFDLSRCVAFEIRRTTAQLREVVPGLVWAFRACGDTCKARDELALVVRRPGFVLSSAPSAAARASPKEGRISLPIQKGVAATAMVVLEASPTDKGPHEVLVVEAEVVQSLSDVEPIAALFVHGAAGDPLAAVGIGDAALDRE